MRGTECQLIRTCDEGVTYYYINISSSCYGLKYRSKYIRLNIIIVENIYWRRGQTYSPLKNLLHPELPADKSYDRLTETLKLHLCSEPIVIAERYKFYGYNQWEGESLTQYLARLRKLTEYCDFGQILEDALRVKYVCGLHNNCIRKILLGTKNLSLKDAVEKS